MSGSSPVSASGFTVSLSASSTSSVAGTPVTLTATTNQSVSGSGYDILIFDQTDGGRLADCSGSSCVTSAVQYTNTTHTYVAYVATFATFAPPPNIQATSNTVAVSYSGAYPLTVTLSASPEEPTVGSTVTLTATATANMTGTGYEYDFYDQSTGSPLGGCGGGASCQLFVTQSVASTHTYIVYIDPGDSAADPPPDVQAASNMVTVTWIPSPSEACAGGQLVVFDGYIGTDFLRVRALTSGSQTLICYRVAPSPTGDMGGNIAITTSLPQVGAPTMDANYQACQAAGSPPVVAGTLLGEPVYIDTYVTASAAWVCVQAGSVQERIIAPVVESGTPSVTQNADPPGVPLPAPMSGPAGYPSSTCQSSGGGASTQFVDANIGGTQIWLSDWQVSSSQVDVCARIAGANGAGGLFTFTVPPVPGLPPGLGLQPTLSTSPSPSPACTTVIAQFTAPVPALLSTSAPSQVNPATVCAGLGGVMESVSVGIAGALTVPSLPIVPLPTVTLDPGTP